MIDPWLLPGPSALAQTVVSELMDGNHCLLVGPRAAGFRRAVEDMLALRQMSLRLVYDEPGRAPGVLMRQAIASGLEDLPDLSPGIWWIEDIPADRAQSWSNEARDLTEAHRGEPPAQRPLLAALMPPSARPDVSLGVDVRPASPLTRVDLEVAARYRTATIGRQAARSRLRADLAVEMAGLRLPSFDALTSLERWLDAPEAVSRDSRALQAAGRTIDETSLTDAEADAILWRVQHRILGPEIEAARLRIIAAERPRLRLPYLHPAIEGRPPKCVGVAEMLELGHLCALLREQGLRQGGRLRRQVEELRAARNTLAHIEPLPAAQALALLDLLDDVAEASGDALAPAVGAGCRAGG